MEIPQRRNCSWNSRTTTSLELFWDALEATGLAASEVQESVFEGGDGSSVDQVRDALVALGCVHAPELGRWYEKIERGS